MHPVSPPTLLVVGVAGLRHPTNALDIYTANSTREAVSTIRLVAFDLLVVGLENPRIDVWDMMLRVHTAWPRQRWMLLSARVSAEEEVAARSLGAIMILHELPNDQWLVDFVRTLSRRQPCEPQMVPTTLQTTPFLAIESHNTV
jgi:DNA-binding response OmpR family regulator